MALEKPEYKSVPEALAELTGRPADNFEVDEDLPMPDPDELESHDAEEFYSDSD